MAAHAFSLFRTPLGVCGIGWSELGVSLLQLPEAHEAATRARVMRCLPEAQSTQPPAVIQAGIDAIRALLNGERRDLAEIELDYSGVPEFHRRVYVAARKVLPGSTVSYGELARRLLAPGAARAVGQALGKNPFAIIVPCHRVLAAGGKLGGFSANGGTATKIRLLEIEGALTQTRDPRVREPTLFDDV